MPLKDGSLTRKEQLFVQAFIDHGDRAKAEKSAGLAPRSGYHCLARPEIMRQITQQQLGRITSEAVPLAVQTLIEIMQNGKAPASARVQAAKVVIDRGLPSDGNGVAKELHEMTPEEIGQAIAALEGQAGALAKDVTPTKPDPTGGIFE